jgi:hypothetical protein
VGSARPTTRVAARQWRTGPSALRLRSSKALIARLTTHHRRDPLAQVATFERGGARGEAVQHVVLGYEEFQDNPGPRILQPTNDIGKAGDRVAAPLIDRLSADNEERFNRPFG